MRTRLTAALTAAVLLFATAACGSSGDDGTAASPPSPPAASSSAPRDSATIAIAGDVHFEGRVADLLANPATAFGPVAEVFRSADYAMVNFETSVTERTTAQPKQYKFKTSPAAFQAVKDAGIDLVSLANNHVLDFGRGGLEDTLAAADAAGVPHIGAGANTAAALAPVIADLNGTRVAFIGVSQIWELWDTWMAGDDRPGIAHTAHEDLVTEAVRDAKKQADVVILMMHWGTEGQECPNGEQKDWAKRLSEAGADAIIGTHAHLMQGEGRLNDSYVFYGLGNFLWWWDDAFSNDTGVLELTVSGGHLTGTRFVPAHISSTGQPIPSSGAEAERISGKLDGLRKCTGLKDAPA
ncbi:hypothetical protein Afil01_03640 [Actinorhabdospora filicis]|uniref:Capsule synthesis protein CapA domain-containing protein n=1 Tax=Actinorhabdospora filicis TaxID=1785913 RepID=A0A9W6SGQ9_9ACTN|nr:CapA family protein [Actinorhabdospora filicis]GLZ75557.1 hypothetical protein Afil01_03640 [Actinorhabdospora filicis]